MKKRVFLYSLLISLVGLLVLMLVTSDLSYKDNVKNTEEYLKTTVNFIDEEATFDNAYALEFSNKTGAFVTVLSGDIVVASSHDADCVGKPLKDGSKAVDVLENGGGSYTGSGYNGNYCLFYCENYGDFSFIISTPIKSEADYLLSALPTVIVVSLIEVFLCLTFSYFCTSFILRPVEELTKQGSISKKVETKYEELQPFVDLMNKKSDEISEKIQEVKEEKELVLKATHSKNEFISNITHEMNTPLTSIKGFAELLKTDNLSEEQRKMAVNTILAQSERLTGLIACIINYNELDNDDLPSYEVNISKIAEETAEILRPQMEKRNITLVKDIDDGVIVQSRYERVNEILGNLIRNAIKYNKEGGNIEITIRSGGIPYLIVKDTGIGVAEENKEKIFDRFFTVDKSHGGKNGGFGLGLAVVKKICKRSGWLLAVESKLGEGTSFIIEFTTRK